MGNEEEPTKGRVIELDVTTAGLGRSSMKWVSDD